MNIEVTELKAETAVAIKKISATMDDIAHIATDGLGKIFAYLAKQGVRITGVPYLAYSNGSADYTSFDVEMGIPVAGEVDTEDGFFMSKNCEGKAVCAMHKGAYKDIDVVYAALMEYLAKNSLESTGVYYDYYINDPADTPESELLTKVVFPVK
ncbi:MAG: GyrI-like domain-containing protein [Clostridiales bacterium]|nr:GyrI-like domain-containing protein [Clostridiales bacterium]